MAVPVVDLLEVVEVEHEDREDRQLAGLHEPDALIEVVQQEPAVVGSGQRVDDRGLLELFHQLLGELPVLLVVPVQHVHDAAQGDPHEDDGGQRVEVGEVPEVCEARDEPFVPEVHGDDRGGQGHQKCQREDHERSVEQERDGGGRQNEQDRYTAAEAAAEEVHGGQRDEQGTVGVEEIQPGDLFETAAAGQPLIKEEQEDTRDSIGTEGRDGPA